MPAAIEQNLKLAGCYALTTDVTPAKLDAEQVHTSYMALEKVERDFRAIKTGLLEVRPIFVRKEGRTRGLWHHGDHPGCDYAAGCAGRWRAGCAC